MELYHALDFKYFKTLYVNTLKNIYHQIVFYFYKGEKCNYCQITKADKIFDSLPVGKHTKILQLNAACY